MVTFVDGRHLQAGTELHADVAVVGAGPAGIVLAHELARGGVDVLLVESGGEHAEAAAQSLSETVGGDPRHDPMALATRRQLGGASNLWGGRCVPYDAVDFVPRHISGGARWPFDPADITAVLPRACDWCECGEAVFDAGAERVGALRPLVPGFTDGEVRTSSLERWSPPTNFRRRHAGALRRSHRIRVATHLTCVEVVRRPLERAVSHLELRTPDGRRVVARARRYVVAAGGLESTRLLLASNRFDAGGLGNHSGHLGRWYMSHVEARVAEVQLRASAAEVSGHQPDADGVYVRRRFTFAQDALLRRDLPNTALWLVNPAMADPRHGNGILSLAYLVLGSRFGGRLVPERIRLAHLGAAPRRLREHARNVRRDLPAAALLAARFAHARFFRRGRKVPGFFVPNPAHRYALLYHAEHLPDPDSRIELTDQVDALGMRRVRTDLRFSTADVAAVEQAHRVLDAALREQGLGHVEFLFDDVEAAVRSQLRGGTHQIGTTRMSARPEDGVLDGDLAVHGFDDLFILSSSAFVTSSQANPTLMLVALAVRLADHLLAPAAPRVRVPWLKRASALPISA